jgi:RimJ/RimL family protein N-acetyltransferase
MAGESVGNILCLVDEDVALRPAQLADLPAIVSHGANSDSDDLWLGLIHVPHPCSSEQANEIVADFMQGWEGRYGLVRLVVDRTTNKPLGKVSLTRRSPSCIEVSYGIAATCRGRGLATRVVRLVADEVLAREHLAERLEAVIDPTNHASVRVATKAGFLYDGVRRGVVPGTGMPFEDLVYVRSRRE